MKTSRDIQLRIWLYGSVAEIIVVLLGMLVPAGQFLGGRVDYLLNISVPFGALAIALDAPYGLCVSLMLIQMPLYAVALNTGASSGKLGMTIRKVMALHLIGIGLSYLIPATL